MVLNYAKVYGQAVDEQYSEIRTSDALWKTPATNRVQWNGGKHVKVPTLSIKNGRKDRKRNDLSHSNIADYSNDWVDYVVQFDREWETTVDPKDVDETNGLVTIATVTDEFNRTEKIPEQDKYMYSTLFKRKVERDGLTSGDIYSTVLTEENILDVFDEMMTNMDENEVDGSRHLYITSTVYNMLKRAEIKNKYVVMNGNVIDRNVHSIDEVDIVKVPSKRMKTDFDFTDGARDKAGAQQIQMFLIADGVHLAPHKYSFVSLEAPSAGNHGLYDYYENEFADVFMYKNKSHGYAVAIAPNKAQNVVEGDKKDAQPQQPAQADKPQGK